MDTKCNRVQQKITIVDLFKLSISTGVRVGLILACSCSCSLAIVSGKLNQRERLVQKYFPVNEKQNSPKKRKKERQSIIYICKQLLIIKFTLKAHLRFRDCTLNCKLISSIGLRFFFTY